ncbi:MAG: fasciclin domain-containing protein [Gemmatimonadales bacterium]|nr:fasciclin domain-containing protein [Gemmatimonadales bacterium]
MRRTLLQFTAAALMVGFAVPASAQNPMVGGKEMFPSKDIIDNAVNSADHTTLVAAVKAAGLVETLKGKGPFTVFAPTNAAFEKLPAGTVPMLLEPGNKGTLVAVLTYHVVPGKYNSKQIASMIKKGDGTAMLTTVQGGSLWFMMHDGKLMLKDAKGGMSMVTIADVKQKNGYIHVIDTVVMP